MKDKSGFKVFISICFALSFLLGMFSIPAAEAHILIIGAPSPDLSDGMNSAAKKIAKIMKAKYGSENVLELYKNKATAKNIIKGMYDADMVIYIGHGGYKLGNYNGNGGTAKPPFALVGYAKSSDRSGKNFIWGIGNKLKKGNDKTLFKAPFKGKIPVLVFQTCFSTGWVNDNKVKNPTKTIYNFAKMFGGSNYYASLFVEGGIIDKIEPGATFRETNNKIAYSDARLKTSQPSAIINGKRIWRNNPGYVAFMGNLDDRFPEKSEVTKYDAYAAEAWYKSLKYPKPDLIVSKATKSGNYLYLVVKNRGNKYAGKFQVKAGNGSYYQKITVLKLGAGKSKSLKLYFVPKKGKVEVDYTKKVREINERNNVKEF